MANKKNGGKKTVPKQCKVLSSYLQAVREIVPADDKDYVYCFRGEALSNWELSSSLARCKASNTALEKKMYEEVLKNYPNEFDRKEIANLNFNDLAKMQHYGIPTDLIDVSLNPLVAMFFATAKAKSKNKVQSGIVYIFKVPNDSVFSKGQKLVFPNNGEKDEKDCGIIQTSYTNERIKQQDGAFLYASTPKQLEKFVFHKIIIQNANKSKIRQELERLNISHKTLFPELSEFHVYLKEAYNLETPKK